MIEKIRNLNELRGGVQKRWPLKDKDEYNKLCDYLQKINYCIQDLNYEIEHNDKFRMKEIVFIIIQTVWIQEALDCIIKSYNKKVLSEFFYKNEDKIKKATRYLNAIRSFAVAHPLTTNRHEIFGLDGNFICVDIRVQDITFPLVKKEAFYHLDMEGIYKQRCESDSFYLYTYSQKDDGMRFFRYIGCSIEDIFNVASLYIDKLYAFDKYLYTQKRSAYEKRCDNDKT